MMKTFFYIILHCLIYIASSQTNSTIYLTDDQKSVVWTPAEGSEIVTVEAEKGYQIKVDILNIHLNGTYGTNGTYVTLKNVNDYNDDDPEETLLTYYITSKPSYFYNNHKIQANYVLEEINNTDTTFNNTLSIRFTRVGELTTTSTSTPSSTTENLPTPNPTENAAITVYIYGKSADSFDEVAQNQLKDVLLKMITDYCTIQLCPLNGSITRNNIHIETLEQCPILWENKDNCIKLEFRVPISLIDNVADDHLWSGYQLDENHLNIIWKTYGKTSMESIGLSLYPVPDVNSMFTHKIVVFCFITVVMVVLITYYKCMMNKIDRRRRRKSKDTCTFVDAPVKNRELSLEPHYLQETPPLFPSDFLHN